jgi:hypothetical protein
MKAPKPVKRVAPRERRAFVKKTVLAWYRDNVIDVYDVDPKEDPLEVIPGEHDGWDEGFWDELSAAFGRAALEGSSDMLEATIGDVIALIAKQWDGNFYGDADE